MISEQNVREILKASTLLKDDHVRVFNYNNTYLIKEWDFDSEIITRLPKEEEFLNYMLENGIRINRLLKYFTLENKIYSIYAFEKKTSNNYDYFMIGSNIRKMHDLSADHTFGFEKFTLRDIDFSEIQLLHGGEIYAKWANTVATITQNYEAAIHGQDFNVVIHHDIIFQNIIPPYTLIDTETLRTGLIYHDIGSIMRLGYRNHGYHEMNEILQGYGIDSINGSLYIFMYLKDIMNMKWLLNNHKNDAFRIKELKNRIENFDNFDYKWTVF